MLSKWSNSKQSFSEFNLSTNFFAGNPISETFMTYVNDIVYEAIESVKTLRNFFNYTVEKDQKDIK